MKLRNIFTALTAAALALVGCQKEAEFLDEVQVSKSFVSLDVDGGEASITVTANAEWVFETSDMWPEIIVRDKEGNVTSSTPSWLSIDKVSGGAGETVVTFSAEATAETREVTLLLACAGVKQNVKVLQMAEKVETPLSTCAEANAGETGKIYRVKGTVTSIANETYGNMYITDETGTVYVYGTLYQGAEKQFSKHGIEVGDIVTVEGPQSPYNGSPQLKNVTVIEIEKSLIKLEKVISTPLPLEGGVATVLLTVKDGEFTVEIPEDAAWLTAGKPSTVGGMTCVELTAAANEGGARSASVTFKTTVKGVDYFTIAEIEQEGAIAAVSVADFLAAAEGTALYSLTGIVKNLKNTTYGNFDLVDATGSVYVYGLTGNGAIGSNDKTFASLGINEGDVITIVGTRASYNGTAQVGGTAYLVEHVVAATVSTVADFLTQSVSSSKWYKLTGTITNLKTGNYGNFDLVDETGTVYVYGLTSSLVAKNDQSFPNLGLKEGDVVTLVGTRAEYNGAAQVGGPAYYISHVEGAAGGEEPEQPSGDAAKYASNVEFTTVSSAFTDNVVNVNGVANVANLKLGTSSKCGEGKVTLPAGTTKVSFYAVAWKGSPAKLEFSVAGTVVGTQEIAANDAATGQAPYNITVTDSDYYTVTLPAALDAATAVTVKTVGTGYRAIIFGVQAK